MLKVAFTGMNQLFKGIMAEVFMIPFPFLLCQQWGCWSASHHINIQEDKLRQRWDSICIRKQSFPDNALTNSSLCHIDQLCNMAIPIWKETRKKNVAYLACTIEAGKREKKGMSFEEANLSFHTLPDLSIELPTDSSASPLGFFQGTSESTYQKLKSWYFL